MLIAHLYPNLIKNNKLHIQNKFSNFKTNIQITELNKVVILPLANATVDSFVSMVYKIPSYLISDLDIKLILLPKYGTAAIASKVGF